MSTEDHNKPDPSFDYHEQAGHDRALRNAGLILFAILLVAIVAFALWVENSDTTVETKLTSVGLALGGLLFMLGWNESR